MANDLIIGGLPQPEFLWGRNSGDMYLIQNYKNSGAMPVFADESRKATLVVGPAAAPYAGPALQAGNVNYVVVTHPLAADAVQDFLSSSARHRNTENGQMTTAGHALLNLTELLIKGLSLTVDFSREGAANGVSTVAAGTTLSDILLPIARGEFQPVLYAVAAASFADTELAARFTGGLDEPLPLKDPLKIKPVSRPKNAFNL